MQIAPRANYTVAAMSSLLAAGGGFMATNEYLDGNMRFAGTHLTAVTSLGAGLGLMALATNPGYRSLGTWSTAFGGGIIVGSEAALLTREVQSFAGTPSAG